MQSFIMNGIHWRIQYVRPESPYLMDRTNTQTVGVTNAHTKTIYLADNMHPVFLKRVLIHEIGHALMFSYNMLPELHSYCKKAHWIDIEEWCCNLLANYAEYVLQTAYAVLGDNAIYLVPSELERLVA